MCAHVSIHIIHACAFIGFHSGKIIEGQDSGRVARKKIKVRTTRCVCGGRGAEVPIGVYVGGGGQRYQ